MSLRLSLKYLGLGTNALSKEIVMETDTKALIGVVTGICVFLMSIIMAITVYNFHANIMIQASDSCEKAVLIYGGERTTERLLICKQK